MDRKRGVKGMSKKPTHQYLSSMLSRAQEQTHEPRKAQPKAKVKSADAPVSLTFKVSPAMYKKLQEIKVDRRTTMQELLEEAVDGWLASIGETGFRSHRDKDDT